MQRALEWLRTPVGRGFTLMMVTTAATGFAMSANHNIVSNFFENKLGLSGPEFGYITAIREIPGFLLIFLTALFYRLPLPRLTSGALVLLAIGYTLFGTATTFWTVAPWVIISSMGYHTWLQTQHALGMTLVTESRSGSILGRLSAVNSGGALVAMLMVMASFRFGWLTFESTYVISGVLALVGAIAIFGFPHLYDGKLQARAARRDPIVLRREYKFYYLLNLLDGGRQQIFFSFGAWVLVHHFQLDVPTISAISLGTILLNMAFGPWLGRMIDRHGERHMLAFVNVAYVFALVGYALIDNVVVAILCYITYSFIFPLSSIGASTYLRKVATRDEIAPSLAMGITMQHAAAVVVPIVTGFVLNYVGYQMPFLVASGFAVLTFFATRMLSPETQKSPARIAEDAQRAAAAAAAHSTARPASGLVQDAAMTKGD